MIETERLVPFMLLLASGLMAAFACYSLWTGIGMAGVMSVRRDKQPRMFLVCVGSQLLAATALIVVWLLVAADVIT